ncbi:hypothetical protein EVAR_40921_1 [Eumeta japonica]|uniref:Uncharacterized protein n=1 Tax=Eumeta variegata TaxID=151549 RepID=A0A4C1X5D0_EUMVA|nr:hypothetical protein EVAR_40921_1 [Eumeta japonica]
MGGGGSMVKNLVMESVWDQHYFSDAVAFSVVDQRQTLMRPNSPLPSGRSWSALGVGATVFRAVQMPELLLPDRESESTRYYL